MGRESKIEKKPNDKEEKFSKKKIIPVQSDSSESSPSPEEPSTPVDSPSALITFLQVQIIKQKYT